ncbi:hypothetical protein [Haloprofundus sp. MHR1]|uniref:hypothetical protein n=1 Tax=Haloprofundus sp. MHR1 TaxID=2572921 RepID=UPI00143CC40B|nr:hypothetical protein [Haloprofundus sp. MHR1]
MSMAHHDDEDEPNDERLINALPTRDIRRGLQNTDTDVDENASRDEILNVLRSHPNNNQLRSDIRKGAKTRVLEEWANKVDNIENAGQGFHVVRDNLSLREIYYYDSYFQYTDHTSRVYLAQELGGLLGDMAESDELSKDEFINFCEADDDLDDAYVQAVEDIPAPLIGDLDDTFRPRLIEFEDENHIYAEYWKTGKTKSDFDVTTGDYEKIRTVYRAVLRIDLRTGLIETAGDSSQQKNKGLVQRFLSEFSGSDTVRRVEIRGADIRRTKDHLALVTTLNEFIGDAAKVRFTRDQSGNVEADPAHADVEGDRDYSRSNFQVIIGKEDGEWGLVYPIEIGEYGEEDEEIAIGEILDAMDSDYEDTMSLTIGLNSEKATFRIQKKSMAPTTRRRILQMLADELDWTA